MPRLILRCFIYEDVFNTTANSTTNNINTTNNKRQVKEMQDAKEKNKDPRTLVEMWNEMKTEIHKTMGGGNSSLVRNRKRRRRKRSRQPLVGCCA
jgi:hypothetical protein